MTPEMRRTLTVIQEYHAQHGVAPTFQEILDIEGGKSKSAVHRRVHALIERGHLIRLPGRDRAFAPMPERVDLTAVPIEQLLVELEKRRKGDG